jgi:ribonuclease HII
MSAPDLHHESLIGYPKIVVAGADEVGRGCLAGPVVAAAVVLPPKIDFAKDPWLSEVHDSKKLSPAIREKLAPLVQKWALAAEIGYATVEEIDRINIFHASHLAIVRAVKALKTRPQHVLIDGKFLPREGLNLPASAVIKGDMKCLSIAAASIIAKVWRDQYMSELETQYPGYGFARHKGYPTSLHAQALKKQGVTPVHRRSFEAVASLV